MNTVNQFYVLTGNGTQDKSLVIKRAERWLSTQRTFYKSLKTTYIDYPDVVTPLLAGIAQMIHGGELLVKQIEKTWYDTNIQTALGTPLDLNDCIGDLFDRPSRIVAGQEAGTTSS